MSERAEIVEQRHISPWLLVIGAVMFGGLVLTLVLGVVFVLQPATPPAKPAALTADDRKMPDGTILRLEKVTFGKRHEFQVTTRRPQASWPFGTMEIRRSIPEHTSHDALMFWLTRREATTGRPLDFDWWSQCVALDEHGREVQDDDAGRNSYTTHSSSGMSGSRPFGPLPMDKFDAIVAHSSVKPFRHAGATFKLRVYDTKGTLVAEFDAPNPRRGPYPEWTPEPLPITKTDGDLSVTLTALRMRRYPVYNGARQTEQMNLEPTFRVTRNGVSTEEWNSRSIQVSDALGNSTQAWNCGVSPAESAWKLQVKMFQNERAKFEPGEQWTVSNVLLAANGTADLIGQRTIVQGVSLELVAVGGSGKVTYAELSPRHGGSASSEGGDNEARYRIETKTAGGTNTTTVDCPRPHVAVRASGLTNDHRLSLRASDERGRDVPAQPTMVADVHFWFLKTLPDARALNFTLTVQRGRNVEFLVAPPEQEPLPETKPVSKKKT